MNRFKVLIDETLKKFRPKNAEFIRLIIAVALTLLVFLDTHFMNNRLISTFTILSEGVAALVMLLIMFLAGFTVLKSLFRLSAEVSLLTLLAQAYCETGATSGDNSLTYLVVIGVAYILYEFSKALWASLKERLASVSEDAWSREKVIVVGLFVIFTTLFLSALYQVTNPVVQNLCIYKR